MFTHFLTPSADIYYRLTTMEGGNAGNAWMQLAVHDLTPKFKVFNAQIIKGTTSKMKYPLCNFTAEATGL
jgi:hypothetical protein